MTLNLAPWLGLEKDLPVLPVSEINVEFYKNWKSKLYNIIEDEENYQPPKFGF